MQAYFGERGGERAHFDQASAILDSNSEELICSVHKFLSLLHFQSHDFDS